MIVSTKTLPNGKTIVRATADIFTFVMFPLATERGLFANRIAGVEMAPADYFGKLEPVLLKGDELLKDESGVRTRSDGSTYAVGERDGYRLTVFPGKTNPGNTVVYYRVLAGPVTGLAGRTVIIGDRERRRTIAAMAYGTIRLEAGFVSRVRVAPVVKNDRGKERADMTHIMWLPRVRTAEDAMAVLSEYRILRDVNTLLASREELVPEEPNLEEGTEAQEAPF